MTLAAAQQRLDALLPAWWQQLQQWALSGDLTAAASQALQLNGLPDALADLNDQLVRGSFSALPPIQLLPGDAMAGAMGAYATTTGTIYLNASWLSSADRNAAVAVLTEELGHHLDGLLNAVDTPGDEGELFATLLGNGQSVPEVRRLALLQQDDHGAVEIAGGEIMAEFAVTAGGATADTTAPSLLSATLSTTNIDVSKPENRQIALTIGIKGDLSGFSYALIDFMSPSGQFRSFYLYSGNNRSGTTLNASFTGSISLDQFAEQGLWSISSINIVGEAGNTRYIDSDFNAVLPGLASLAFQVSNSNPSDIIAPSIVSATLSTTNIDVSKPENRQIALTIGAKDDLSGFSSASIDFMSPSGQFRSFYLSNEYSNGGYRSGTTLNGSFTDSISFNQFAEQGLWTISSIYINDKAGNYRYIDSDFNAVLPGLDSLAFQVSSSNPSDIIAPSLVSATLSTTNIDVSKPENRQIALTIGAKDDLSGFSYALIQFKSPSGQVESFYLFDNDFRGNYTSGTTLNGSFTDSISLDQFAEQGLWTISSISIADKAGNTRDIDSDFNAVLPGLASLAFQVSNSNTSPQPTPDSTPPTITSATLSSTTIDLNQSGSGLISLNLGIKDNISGFKYAYFTFKSPSGQYLYTQIETHSSGSELEGIYFGSSKLTEFSESGLWKLDSASIGDKAGNYLYKSGADLNSLLPGLQSLAFQVINSKSDTIAPSLTTATLSSTTIDLNQPGSGFIGLNLGIKDNTSGFESASFTFKSPSGKSLYTSVNTYSSGSTLDGIYFGSSKLDEFAEPGLWKLSSASIRDKAGNSLDKSGIDLNSLLPGLQSLAFQVINSKSDTIAPSLTSATLSSTEIDLNQPGSGLVCLNLEVQDNASGFASGHFTFKSPLGKEFYINASSYFSGTKLVGTYFGSSKLDDLAEAGLWKLSSASIEDNAGNRIYKSGTDLNSLVPGLQNLAFSVVRGTTVVPPVVSLSVSPASVSEDSPTNLVFTFTRTGATTDALSVNYTVSGTALQGTDYTGITPWTAANPIKSITFAAGSATATLVVDPIADTTPEPDETLTLRLESGNGYTIASPPGAQATGTITNDDFTTLSTVGGVALLQDPGNGRFWVSRDGGPASAITWGGAPLAGTTLPDWQLLAAAGGTGGNSLLWRHRTSGDISTWSLDDNWVSVGGSAPMAPSSAEGRKAERRFQIDLNGDGVVGAPTSTLSRIAGQQLLRRSRDGGMTVVSPGADSRDLQWGGQPLKVDDSRLRGWTPLAAARVANTNQLLWKQAATGNLTTWTFDDRWNPTGGTPVVNPSSDDAYALESAFGLDANGDRSVGNPYVPIASSGNASLLRHGSSHQLAFRSAGLNLNLSWGSAPLLDADPRLPDWSAIAAARLNGLPSLLWRQATTGNLATWSFDNSGNASGGTPPVAPSSADALSLESAFRCDANGDGRIGSDGSLRSLPIPLPQPLSLLQNANRWSVSTGTSSSSLIWAGTPIAVTDSRLPGWAPAAAAILDGVNSLLWTNSSLSLAAVWSFDSSWNATGGAPAVPLSSNDARDLESLFNTDLNGDRSIGSPFSSLAAGSDLSLLRRNDDQSLVIASSRGSLSSLSWGGAPLKANDSRLQGWTALAAARVANTNQLLWKQSGSGNLTTWTFDDRWNPTGGTPIVNPSSNDAYALESAFAIDANGDRSIGNPYNTLAVTPSASLLRHGSSGRLAISSNGASPIPLSWGGSDLLEADPRLSGWTPLAAARVANTNQLLWKQANSGNLVTWTFDDRWNPTGGTPIVSPSSDDALALEDSFAIDANGDGVIGEPLSPIERLRSRILATDPNANARDPFSAVVSGGAFADTLTAPAGDNVLISGYDPVTGIALPPGAIDSLDAGLATSRCTVLLASPTGQPFANDGDSGYTLVRNIDAARDDLVLPANLAITTASRTLTFEGATVTGLGLHLDTNNNGAYDNSDNLIALLAGVTGPAPRIIRI